MRVLTVIFLGLTAVSGFYLTGTPRSHYQKNEYLQLYGGYFTSGVVADHTDSSTGFHFDSSTTFIALFTHTNFLKYEAIAKSWDDGQIFPKVGSVSGSEEKPILPDQSARYNPDIMNSYHLFTRENPTLSQPIVLNNEEMLIKTNYDPERRTIVLIHGWLDSATAPINTVLVPAFLEAEDVNVIVVDWANGSGTVAYPIAVINTSVSGASVAKFITWLNNVKGSTLSQYHIVGHNLGAHQAGIVGRHLEGKVAYISGLDPALAGWVTNDDKFQSTDAEFTEVIHTNAGRQGYLSPLADADFYPNGGIDMPGCLSQECDSNRSFHYFGESIRRGGFSGTRCYTFASAMAGQCFMSGSLKMGGITPKTGQSGIFYLRTNAFPPFSRG